MNSERPLSPNVLNRVVFGVLGVPLDASSLPAVLQQIRDAVLTRRRFFISTVNVNFVVISQRDADFRESLYASDLCTVDGTPVVWLLRLLGVTSGDRIAGSDLFDTLLSTPLVERQLRVGLFGGEDGAAQQAAAKINSTSRYAECVAAISPGFASVDELSSDHQLAAINSSNADFLSVSLGSLKGQLWLLRNDARLAVPVRAHLGAVVNFQAGTVVRAPQLWRRCGVEWLWRIKEEPQLFNRYWKDGWILLYLLATKLLPLAINLRWSEFRFRHRGLKANTHESPDHVCVVLSGAAIDKNLRSVMGLLADAIARNKTLILDLADVETSDPRFMGMSLVMSRLLERAGLSLKLRAASRRVRWQFRLNGFDFLLEGRN